MKPLTAQLLADLYGSPVGICAQFVAPLTATMAANHIDLNLNTEAAFLGTIGVESGGLQRLSENLNYSAQGLANTWPTRYALNPAANPKVPNDLARRLHREPQAIANNVYANRMGNGDEASGDGWRFRGAGLIQLTGRENQTRYAAAAHISPGVEIGDWLRTPQGAADSAGWFWAAHSLNSVAIGGDMAAVTRIVNGGTNGLAERMALFTKAKALLA